MASDAAVAPGGADADADADGAETDADAASAATALVAAVAFALSSCAISRAASGSVLRLSAPPKSCSSSKYRTSSS